MIVHFNTTKFNQPASNPVAVAIDINDVSSIAVSVDAIVTTTATLNGTSTIDITLGILSKLTTDILDTSAIDVNATTAASLVSDMIGTSSISNPNIQLEGVVGTIINDISNITIVADVLRTTLMEFYGISEVAISLGVVGKLAANIADTSDVNANATALVKLTSDFTSISTIESTIINAKSVAADISGESAISITLGVVLSIGASITSDSSLTAQVVINSVGAAVLQSTSQVASNIQVTSVVGIAVNDTSSIIAGIVRSIPFAASMIDVSAITLNIVASRNVATSMFGTSQMTLSKFDNLLIDEFNEPSRQLEAYVEMYFDPSNPEIVSYGIIDFTLLEELKADTNNPVGDITANEFMLSIDNTLRRFSPTNINSDLYGKLVPGIKIKPYLTILFNGIKIHQDIGLGTFYAGDWDSPSQSTTCTITCNDRMYTIMNLPFSGIKVIANTTYAALYAMVFKAAGLTEADYNIDPALNKAVKMAHIQAGTVGTALKQLSEASGSYVYTARDNVIQAKVVSYDTTPFLLNEASNQIIDHTAPTRYLETYSAVNIPYYTSSITKDVRVASLSDYTLLAGENIITDINFSNAPLVRVTRIEMQGAPSAKIKYYDATANKLTVLCIENAGAETEAQIIVFGEVCEYTSIGVSVQDATLVPYVGSKELKIENTLIQTKEHAEWYANRLAQITSNPCPTLSLSIRGNPFIKLAGIVEATDERHALYNQRIVVTRSELRYAGSLSGSISGYILPQEVI